MSANSSRPADFTSANFQEMFDYIKDQQQFTTLLSDIAKDFLLVDYPKNKKENIIGYWLAIKLRILIGTLLQNVPNCPPIKVMPQDRVSGLLERSSVYNLVIYIDDVPAIVVDINFIINNLKGSLPRIFKDVVYNATNINQYKGMEYVSLFIFAESTPSFSSSKQYEREEELSIMSLLKLTTLSLCPHNRFQLSTMILTPFVDGTTGKPKVKKPNLSNYSVFQTQSLRDSIPLEIFQSAEAYILMNDINKFIQSLLRKIQVRIFGQKGNS